MKNKKILLVGGSGFIGHNLALKLREKGANPVVVDSLAVNNILSNDGKEVHNKELYNSILKSRLDLLKKRYKVYHSRCQRVSYCFKDI